MTNFFGWVDYVVVAATLLFSILIGVYYAVFAKQETSDDLLLGGKKMGIAPIAASMLVTYLSAITVLGYPAEIYGYGAQIFMTTITYALIVPGSIYFFMTVFYKMQLTSVYEYLENRFDSTFCRCFASFLFIIQMSMFMGVCLFAPSIALSSFMGLELWQSVVGLGICATVYTSIGGLRAVVWTDVFQLFMILAGMLTIIVKGFISAGGVGQAFTTASEHGRLQLFDWTIDPFMRHNTLNIFLGQGFTIFCLYGTHQPQVQRYCSVPTLGHAIKASIFAIPLNVCTVILCFLAGVVIFSTYAGCDPFILGHIKRVDHIVPFFVIKELSFIPGMMGLFTACVFSASLSTLSSGLNSIAAVIWEDFLNKIPALSRMKQKHRAHMIRLIAIVFGFVSIGLAFLAQNMGAILSATMTALGALNGPLGSIFAMGLLFPFINKWGAISSMVGGFLIMIWITVNAFILGKSHIPLDFSAEDCITGNETLVRVSDIYPDKEEHWPNKLYTISYVLYPFVGGVISFIIGIVVSILTGGIQNAKNVDPKYLHPLVRKKASPKSRSPQINGNLSKNKMTYNNNIDRIDPEQAKRISNIFEYEAYNRLDQSINSSRTDVQSPISSRGETPLMDSDKQAQKPLLYRMPK